jgi:hypothetical protein
LRFVTNNGFEQLIRKPVLILKCVFRANHLTDFGRVVGYSETTKPLINC